MKSKVFYLICALALLFSLNINAARPVVKVSSDSVNLQMGRITELNLTVTEDNGAKGHFPIFKTLRENGVIPVCGDSVELRTPFKSDTVLEGNTRRISMKVPLQAFDSGYYKIPEFIYVYGKDTVRSNSIAIKVYPVLADANTPIDDYAGTADPAGSSIFDSLPDWMLDYWWILVILLLAIGLGLYALRKYKKQGFVLPKKPEPTPYEVAMAALAELKSQKLWEQGMEKEYFTRLTDILRVYLYRRFGINAMEMTSRQILASLSKNDEIKDKRSYFRKILDMADFVKFAKVRPLPDDNIESFDNAVRFVEETKPVPVAPDAETKDNPGSAAPAGTADSRKGGKK